MFPPLTERQEHILSLVVRNHIETGSSIGSNTLVDRHNLDVSSATVRNDLAVLDEQGYVTQRHTSGGRLPTELGYRYFVQKLLGDFRLPLPEQQMIRHQFHQARLDLNQWMRLAAAILARTSHGASLVTSPHPRPNRFKHIQLISTQGRMVLMIIVLFGGDVHQQMLTLAEPISQARLSMAAERLNQMWENADYDEISSRMHHGLDTLEFEITRLILEVLHRADNRPFSNFYRDGLANIIEDEGTRQAVRVLEERSLLANVLMETQVPSVGDVQVLIGGESRWEELKDCTVILSRYGVVEQFSGTVAVIGPVRMPYGRNVAAVRYVADLMSNFLGEYYTLDAPDEPTKEIEEYGSE